MDIRFKYNTSDPTLLCKFMQLNNCDKGNIINNSKYNYSKVYDSLFRYVKYNKMNIIEFGCDRNDGSLRAMSKYFLNSDIYGTNMKSISNIDIERITLIECDYTDKLSINNVLDNKKYDIMIDKWILFKNYNYLFEESIKHLNDGGIYIIENIIISEVHTNSKLNELNNKYSNLSFRFEQISYKNNTIDNCILFIQKNRCNKKHFITFGNIDYYPAVKRLCEQANQCNIFSEINGYKEDDLKRDEDFWLNHGKFIENNRRGYGYWIWKPYLILKKLEKMNNGEGLLYLDAGCEINWKYTYTLLKILNTNKEILGTTTMYCDNINYTKPDTIEHIGCLNKMKLYEDQMQAGSLYIIKSDFTLKLIKEWYELCYTDNYHYLDDSPSKIFNPNFIENRHDQSIFSLLTIKYNIVNNDLIPTIVSTFNCENNWPINCMRNRTEISKLNSQTYWNNNLNDNMYNNIFKNWVGDCNAISKIYLYNYLIDKNYKNILDVGCADGTLCEGLNKYNIDIKYTGVDSCKYFINKCKEKNINVIESDIRYINSLSDSSFDLVYGRHVAEHQDCFENLFNEMIRISTKEVIHTFFIIPDLTNDKNSINYTFKTDLYHNKYSYNEISLFLKNHNKVKFFKHYLIPNTNESILHIML